MASCSVASFISDEDLIHRCRGGEEDAFSELYGRYRHRILSTAYRIIKNPEDAQDATQEIFLKMYRSISRWNPGRSRLSTWLYRLAANHAIDCWRARHRRLKSEIADDAWQTATSRLRDADPRHAPYRVLEAKELVGRVRRCLDSLPPLQRKFFILRYFYGMTLEDIAVLENRSIGTVKGLLYRATRRVRKLGGIGHHSPPRRRETAEAR